MANLNNPVNVLYQDATSGQPVAVTDEAPLPVIMSEGATETTMAALLAIIGTAEDVAGANTVMGQLKQIAENTATP